MGQQQLLLIIIGMIVLAAAIAGGNLLFKVHSESSAKDNIISECSSLGSLAQQYYNKSAEMGGGDKSFIGWSISEHIDSTHSAIYSIILANDEKLILRGTPQKDKNYSWAVKTTVTKYDIFSEIME
ncbi:MAG: hypothetical protein JSW63_13010 [Ignavibacterium sp.]|nr:MAG: hypothetical protein JSW63_13010 [Ignavibacterium sp.]